MILGLDMATKTGWALVDHEGFVILSGVVDLKNTRRSHGETFCAFQDWLAGLLERCDWLSEPLALIAFEAAHFRGGNATEVCLGLQTHLQSFAHRAGVQVRGFTTSAVKKSATGNGAADKSDMIREAARLLGREPLDDNEADAVHVARMGAASLRSRAVGAVGAVGAGAASLRSRAVGAGVGAPGPYPAVEQKGVSRLGGQQTRTLKRQNKNAAGQNKNAAGQNKNAAGQNKNAYSQNKNAYGQNKNAAGQNKNAAGQNKNARNSKMPK